LHFGFKFGDYHFKRFDFNADKKIDFTLSSMDGKEDMLFLEPKSGTLFAKAKNYEKLRGYNIKDTHFNAASQVVYPGAMLLFKTKDNKIGKMKILNIKNGKIAFEWKWL